MSASIWNPAGTVVPTVNANLTLKSQKFTATAGQTQLNLTLFQYQPGTGSLLVEVNGVDQFLTDDYTETSSTQITMVSPLNLGDKVVVRGFVGGDQAQTAATSAAIAVAASNAAVNAPSTFATSTTNLTPAAGAQTLVIQTGKLFLPGMGVLISFNATSWMFGQITSYDSVTGNLVVNVVSTGTDLTARASWYISLSATQLSLPVSIAAGGTGQTTKAAGFDALAPAHTKGSLIVGNGATNIELAVGSDGQVLIADSTQAAGVKYGYITNYVIKTVANTGYTASNGDQLAIDTSGGAVTIVLPIAPTAGKTRIDFLDYASSWATNKLTISRNGKPIMGLAEDMTVGTNDLNFGLLFIDNTAGWRRV